MNVFNDEHPSRAAQKAATAERVLAAARDEFEKVGFDAASVRTIAKSASVSVGTVLHHYGDKRQLLYASLHAALARGLAAAIAGAGRPPLEAQLHRLAAGILAVYEARPVLSRTLLKEGLFADGVWGARFITQTTEVHVAICALARAAVERGELPPNEDVEAVSLAFISFFHFALLSWMQGAPLPRGPLGLIDRLLAAQLSRRRESESKSKSKSESRTKATAKRRLR